MSSKRPPALHDHEITMMVKICQQLATLQPGARRRVLAYISARVETLPVIAGVGGGVEEDPTTDQPFMFNRTEQREEADAAQ